ncbi:ABC transporter ATP-binding protein [Rhizobium sp. Root1220]|uniref:oligopeptide/dipeptide ABC transporter ATP-binding protein n=1 Tax=Rhizobium sp. Root1220 TaxID=1736432 RepID=UPI0006F1F194|nr:ABC transporter ATP-binding protein [Rhizobium sp. Root1220]KQV73260.1 hypothetical protein ASC90_07640 [Rhizobium sp. Root1220]
MTNPPILAVRNLCISFRSARKSVKVLDDVDLSVASGENLAVVGESGSGKTSLGLAVQGLLAPSGNPIVAGSIEICGQEVIGSTERSMREIRRHLVRAIPQDGLSALNPTMTIANQLLESATVSRAIILDWLSRTGIKEPERILERYPHQLSGGQRQRVLVAMAMMAQPRLLIADEPTAALDTDSRAEILNMLDEIVRERDTAVLFITHDLAASARISDRTLVLYSGRAAETGATGRVTKQPAHPYTAGLLKSRFDFESDRTRPLPVLREDDRLPVVEDACHYSHRCPIARPKCFVTRPPIEPTPDGEGAVACFFTDKTRSLENEKLSEKWPLRPQRSTAVVLEMRSVRKSLTEHRANRTDRRSAVLEGFDLHVNAGEAVALIGASGSGKSTVLRIAAGITPADSGLVKLGGGEGSLQFIFQDAFSSLTPWLSIGRQISDRLRHLDKSTAEKRVDEVLRLVRLRPELASSLPSELSIGQCQRAVIARAIAVPPSLLLCDEPISALDVSLASSTLNLLGELRHRLGMAMIFVTHDMAAARYLADRIVWLHGGVAKDLGRADSLNARQHDLDRRPNDSLERT